MNGQDKKVNSRFFGRQIRIDFVEKLAYIIVGIFAVGLVFYLVTQKTDFEEVNVNYAYLATYMQQKGFTCELLNRSGGKCYIVRGDTEYSFYRYDDGLQYIIKSESYSLNIKHLSGADSMEFRTYNNAYIGYRDSVYQCTYKDGFLSELDKCVTSDGTELDLEVYLGFIRETINDLNNIVEASGYERKPLIENYEWVKK